MSPLSPEEAMNDAGIQAELLQIALGRHAARARDGHDAFVQHLNDHSRAIREAAAVYATPQAIATAWGDYLRDASQRGILTLDTLRQRADIFLEHQANGSPPVLIYDYEVVMEGRDLPRRSNYMLLGILPKPDQTIHDWKRPYVIIDPRAGHGAGIGGFKQDSQVGVALSDGHPVYFVAFHPDPEPGQTIADVTYTEAAFLKEVMRRHPNSPKPIVVGNCQGGWATAILAATHPELTGPIVLNGAPMSYWGGKLGQDPMRYSGGLAGGVLPALVASDLGGGLFDGANLVANFEMLNPGRTWFRKYADLYENIDTASERFLDFERWWGGFYLMTEAEIRWIVETLFVGNKLGKNEAYLEPGRPIDLKKITAPVIVFASHGDNITPPAQALNWIIDTYADEIEIEIRGQRILYMVHEQVGHLGIFVSSSVAKREHTQMASTMKTIEALAPGLYEMRIEDHQGEGIEKSFTVSFAKRTMADIIAVTSKRRDEAAFAGVARASETMAESYDTTLRPWIQTSLPHGTGEVMRRLHPMRLSRAAMSSGTPGATLLAEQAARVAETRTPAAADNPFILMERLSADLIERSWDMLRDWREMAMEASFFALWASPAAIWYGLPNAHTRTKKAPRDLRSLAPVQLALSRLHSGGLAEGIIRMLVLLADSRGDVRRDRLERSTEVLSTQEPFAQMDAAARAGMIHEQGLIAHFEPDAGLDALPDLLRNDLDRARALKVVNYVIGDQSDMAPKTAEVLGRIKSVLGHATKAAE